MKSTSSAVTAELKRYIRTGDTDPHHAAWPDSSFMARHRLARDELRTALIEAVRQRSGPWQPPESMRDLDVVALTRSKVEPMVRGLFPRSERDAVLALLERSVVFLTPDNIDELLRGQSWPRSAWNLANLYLGGIGAELLSDDAPAIVGLSQDTTCFVSPAYFDEQNPFADFLVHEVAHIFHNCKRNTASLKQTRRREWLLNIAFAKRETFAYSCEAYAWILDRGTKPADRVALASELGDEFGTADERVQLGEVARIVREAVTRRNGWKVILAHCAPARVVSIPHSPS